jgi:hypothetical protein
MKSNTTGNYLIAIEGTSEEIQLEKVNERLRTQTIKLVGQRVDLRAGIYHAMIKDKNFAELICHSAEYYKSVNPNSISPLKTPDVKETTPTAKSPRRNTPAKRKG